MAKSGEPISIFFLQAAGIGLMDQKQIQKPLFGERLRNFTLIVKFTENKKYQRNKNIPYVYDIKPAVK